MDKIPVTKSSMPPYEEYIEEIRGLWESRWLTNGGEKHQALEAALPSVLGSEKVSLFANGHLALEAVLAAMELTGEVITTPFTFASTTQAIVRQGLTPVFCDIDPVTYTMDPNKIEALITEKTSAILPVHVYGTVCDVDAIEEIAKKHNLKVIYDAAHVFGVKVGDRGIGAFGDAAMFSFHATKVFHCIEGGCVAYDDPALEQGLKRQRNFGMDNPESYPAVGGNAKMNEFSAAMGLCNLRYVNGEIQKRKKAVMRYRQRLCDTKGLTLWREQEGIISNYAYFPVLFDKVIFGKSRDEVAEALAEKNITARKYFYPLTSQFACYEGLIPIQETPVAEAVAKKVLCLPLYADMTEEQVDQICDCILK